MPKVFNKFDPDIPASAVYVGRPTKWGNPFKVADYGRGTALQEYSKWIKTQPQLRADARRELRGKDLVCWCKPDACHADILMSIANG